jgi:energy-coupling factor transporter ATP-binding protein EcfA2
VVWGRTPSLSKNLERTPAISDFRGLGTVATLGQATQESATLAESLQTLSRARFLQIPLSFCQKCRYICVSHGAGFLRERTDMLIEFFGENFGCFRDKFRLSMLATDIDPDSGRGVTSAKVTCDPEPLRLLRAAAIYGPNASGKSTLLRAARALQGLIMRAARFRSDEEMPFYEPFAGGDKDGQPVRLGIKAVIDGAVYDYEISFKEREVLSEQLEQQFVDRTAVLFNRQGADVSGEWTSDEQFGLIAKEFRANALLLSLADTLAPTLARGIAPSLGRLLRFFDGSNPSRIFSPFTPPAARLASQNLAFKQWLLQQLQAADVGVTEVAIKRERRIEHNQGVLFEEVENDDESNTGGQPLRHRLAFKHTGPHGLFAVPYEDESFGTRKIVELSPILFSLFSEQSPRAAFIDEIGASLHPTLLTALIRHINCETRAGPVHGQLIFATHETSLIDDEAKNAVLRRDQVYFTEKDALGVARLYSLSDFQERQNINIRKRYLEGRYGAIPSLVLRHTLILG